MEKQIKELNNNLLDLKTELDIEEYDNSFNNLKYCSYTLKDNDHLCQTCMDIMTFIFDNLQVSKKTLNLLSNSAMCNVGFFFLLNFFLLNY